MAPGSGAQVGRVRSQHCIEQHGQVTVSDCEGQTAMKAMVAGAAGVQVGSLINLWPLSSHCFRRKALGPFGDVGCLSPRSVAPALSNAGKGSPPMYTYVQWGVPFRLNLVSWRPFVRVRPSRWPRSASTTTPAQQHVLMTPNNNQRSSSRPYVGYPRPMAMFRSAHF